MAVGLHGEPPHLNAVRESLSFMERFGVIPVLTFTVLKNNSREVVIVVEGHLFTNRFNEI